MPKNPPEFYDLDYFREPVQSLGWGVSRGDDHGAHMAAAVFAHRLMEREGLSGRVVDVGCGIGWVVRNLRNLGRDAIGIEYGREAVKHSVCDAVWGDVTETLPLEDGSVDLAICLGVLSQLPEAHISHAIGELRRITTSLIWANILTEWSPEQRHHRTIRPATWWAARFLDAGLAYCDARDLIAEHDFGRSPEQYMSVWRK